MLARELYVISDFLHYFGGNALAGTTDATLKVFALLSEFYAWLDAVVKGSAPRWTWERRRNSNSGGIWLKTWLLPGSFVCAEAALLLESWLRMPHA